eukprot:1347852-Pyramimonas_sp.AAC.1
MAQPPPHTRSLLIAGCAILPPRKLGSWFRWRKQTPVHRLSQSCRVVSRATSTHRTPSYLPWQTTNERVAQPSPQQPAKMASQVPYHVSLRQT